MAKAEKIAWKELCMCWKAYDLISEYVNMSDCSLLLIIHENYTSPAGNVETPGWGWSTYTLLSSINVLICDCSQWFPLLEILTIITHASDRINL